MKVKAQDSISARELWRDMLQFLRQARLPYLLIVLATVIALARSKIALLIPSYMQQFYAGDFSTHIILLLIGTGILRYVISMACGPQFSQASSCSFLRASSATIS